MTDELDRLKTALEMATPPAADDAKARAILLAQKKFATRQGSANKARPKHNGSEKPAGFVTGVKNMFANFRLRPALYATSSLAVLGLGIMVVLPLDELSPPSLPGLASDTKSDKVKIGKLADTPVLEEPLVQNADVQLEVSEQAVAPSSRAKRAASPAPVAGLLMSEADDLVRAELQDNERFANAPQNPLKITSEEPVSTFSIDVDTASYAYVRAAIMDGYLPDADAVRVEEMVNYFPYSYPAPADSAAPFATSVSVFQTPWNANTKLVHIGIQGDMPAIETRPPLDLVFLIDTSGSMQNANKLPLLKQSFRLLLSRLNPQDRISMVAYAGSSGVVLEPTQADDTATILAALDKLEAGGATAGQSGLQLAYAQADKMHQDGRIGRVLLATDGDFNVGISDPEKLKKYIETKRDSGTYLSVLGFGRGNYNDALMQSLAQNGNGTASYIDTLSEAQKVLVDQVSGALFPIANDVKVQVEFNPALIAEYRLVGYETRVLAREDFNNDKVDAGDIGAGHTITAIYEITPTGSPAIKSDPLRYQQVKTTSASDELGFLKLRYKLPGESTSALIQTPIINGDTASEDARFSAAIAGFGQLLRVSKYMESWSYTDAIALANSAKGDDPFGYRTEAITLMRLADSLSQ